MVFNQRARDLLAFCGADVDIPSHDWWLYQVTSACGGNVHYDAYPSVRYRQHTQNVIGSNIGFAAGMRPLPMLQPGGFRPLADLNLVALTPLPPPMSAENQKTFHLFFTARPQPI